MDIVNLFKDQVKKLKDKVSEAAYGDLVPKAALQQGQYDVPPPMIAPDSVGQMQSVLSLGNINNNAANYLTSEPVFNPAPNPFYEQGVEMAPRPADPVGDEMAPRPADPVGDEMSRAEDEWNKATGALEDDADKIKKEKPTTLIQIEG